MKLIKTRTAFKIFFLLATGFFCKNCASIKTESSGKAIQANPAAQGFDEKNSDPEAIAIADQVMLAMGGRKAWDETKVINWEFFGRRNLVWNKWTGDVKIEIRNRPIKIEVNINTEKGKVWLNGIEQTHPDSLSKYLKRGKEIWINDSYWLVMPFKLKDSGATLKFKGRTQTEDGREADLLQLTFSGVGVTPENKYFVWVDKETRLVSQWAFFEKFLDTEPRFVNPWKDYKPYGKILLSGDRGRKENLYPILVEN